MSADPIDGAWIAHVAEVLEDFHGAADYDAAADYAHNLLAAYPALREMASQFANGDAGREWLADAVATAVQSNAVEQGGSPCPTCGLPLESRVPFDGTEPSTGVVGGHQGFGQVYQCESGHWFTWIQGKLVGPEHIMTVVERGE